MPFKRSLLYCRLILKNCITVLTTRQTVLLALLIAVILSGLLGCYRNLVNLISNPVFEKRDVFIPMRDGVRLHAEINIPKNSREELPLLLTRTPYSWRTDQQGVNASLSGSYKELAQDGYIFVFQDIRGRFKSEGQFVMLRPPRDKNDPKAIDESTDTYDTIEWLLKNVPMNNGRVGVLGVSYPGWLTVMAMIDPHPAVKAVSEQASPADMFIGDDFFHNGAFRLSYGLEYVAAMETSNVLTPFKFDKYDRYAWYLDLGSLSNVNQKYFHGKLPTWNAFMEHAIYDDYWKKLSVPRYLDRVTVPNLNVAGWWDQEDFYGPVKIYETLEQKDSKDWNFLVIGPWNHGGWNDKTGRALGKIDFESDTAKYFRERVQTPWFAYWLKNKGRLELPEALVFRTGTNRWHSERAWPPRQNIVAQNLYFARGGRLSFAAPQENNDQAFDTYVSDPAHPVPYLNRPITREEWRHWLVQDQRFVDNRPDVLSWQTDVLNEDVTVAGKILAHLFASTSGTDSDWIVKLIDVYPEEYPKDPKMGAYQLMIANEVLRAKFREGFENPKPVPPNQVIEYVIDLHTADHCFLKGHRIMVQVQSTWFPVIDRNPQRFVNIPSAQASDYQMATQRIYRSKKFPSLMTLPIVKQ